MTSLPSLLPNANPKSLFQAGFVVSSNSIPRRLQGIYRRGIKAIADFINEHPDSPAGWQALQLYDAMVLSPSRCDDESFAVTLERRLVQFLAGDFRPLLMDLVIRDPSSLPKTSPSDSDPRDARAVKCQRELLRNHSTGGAARALDAPLGTEVHPGARAAAFLKLNPSVGDPAPPPPPPHVRRGPCQGGGDVPPRDILLPRPATAPSVRRPFSIHWDPDPPLWPSLSNKLWRKLALWTVRKLLDCLGLRISY